MGLSADFAFRRAVVPRLLGTVRHRGERAWPPPPLAILFDRDGTLVHDVPYNGDPALVHPVEGAVAAVAMARRAGLKIGVVSNQSGIGRGLLSRGQVEAVNAQVDRLVGPFDSWQYCPHTDADGCGCRKPRPGLIHRAARALRVPARRCVVIGDRGADVEAARAAGATAVLVPTETTAPAEIAYAPLVASSLGEAVALVCR